MTSFFKCRLQRLIKSLAGFTPKWDRLRCHRAVGLQGGEGKPVPLTLTLTSFHRGFRVGRAALLHTAFLGCPAGCRAPCETKVSPGRKPVRQTRSACQIPPGREHQLCRGGCGGSHPCSPVSEVLGSQLAALGPCQNDPAGAGHFSYTHGTQA